MMLIPPPLYQSSISFHSYQNSKIRTLSTNTADDGDTMEGLLYVPDLDHTDPCRNISRRYVAHNTARQANLPATDYSLIALAPWISPNCTLSYLTAARADPTRAFIFYPTDGNTNQPPPMSDPMWGLDDGGQWKSHNKYPVYAVPGKTGAKMMHHLGRYSGNMTDVEHGHLLTELYDSRDYVRLFSVITTSSPASLPSLWAFLIIILGMLLLVIVITSLLMHYVQRRHRQALQRRVANGEVDLEALGIKRLTVPQEVVDRMPLFVYAVSDKETSDHPKSSVAPVTKGPPQSPSTEPTTPSLLDSATNRPAPTSSLTVTDNVKPPTPGSQPPLVTPEHTNLPTLLPRSNHLPHHLPYSQPSCPICLEDFLSHTTTVRELPCAHIFHPDCVDTFLTSNSSLCPMCKKSVLPNGYCPANITNAMVRRERLLRRMRERVTVEVVDRDGDVDHRSGAGAMAAETMLPVRQRPSAARWGVGSFYRPFVRVVGRRANENANTDARRTSSAPALPFSTTTTVEMVQTGSGTDTSIPVPIPSSTPGRSPS
ncbi:hypothetical protein MMC16_000859 [Acarospora aff. strigata]|nr:hypothetical protein [Acarospora aff. strigata]